MCSPSPQQTLSASTTSIMLRSTTGCRYHCPTADNEVIFSNYTDRQQRGLFAQLPTVYSSNDAEGSSLLAYTPDGPPGGQAAIDSFNKNFGTCSTANGALSRKNLDVPVWRRIRYFGQWPNLNPFS